MCTFARYGLVGAERILDGRCTKLPTIAKLVQLGEHQMTEEAKIVTSTPETETKDQDEKKPLDTNRPVALPGVSHQHLENQQGVDTKTDKKEEAKKS